MLLGFVGAGGTAGREAGRGALSPAARPMVVSIVGIDGCGKSSAFEGALAALAPNLAVAGVGDTVLGGAPGEPLRQRVDVPRTRLTRAVGRLAKGLRTPSLYKNVKFLDLTERTRLVDHIAAHDGPAVIVCDGDPLVNTAAWAAARFARERLASDDALEQGLALLTREKKIPLRRLPQELRRSWQLTLLSALRLGRFAYPDLVVLLRLDPAVSLARIEARGKPLQVHETAEFLTELGRAYDRVCALLERRRGIPVLRLQVDRLSPQQTVERIVAATSAELAREADGTREAAAHGDRIDIVATTMSGSIDDQRKLGRIGPEFRARTRRPVRVHTADTHAQAQALAHEAVRRGGRLLVSAGGAGTFNAVLEGAFLDGRIPTDLRLAFLRKGSADLIGKVLGIPDTLPEAARAIVGGIESGDTVAADVLAVETTGPHGERVTRHLVGFGGLGVFGDIPRFTESRLIKTYKGILGQLFGDLGPFMTGFALATIYWNYQRIRGRRPRLALVMDGEELPLDTWVSVIVLNGDLGHDFKLGRGLDLASGSFRVIALRYRGLRETLKQTVACRTAAVLDDPARYAAIVRDLRALTVRPERTDHEQMVNVDGLRLVGRGAVNISVGERIALVPGNPHASPAGP